MLCLEDVAIGYAGEKGGERVVARGISESLCRGEMACLIGSNGVGKSTLLRSICGLQPLLAGRVMVDGSDVALLSRRQRAGHVSIVLTSVDRDLSLSAAEVVALGRSPYTDFWGTLSASDRQIVEASMSSVGIANLAQRRMSSLSDGERQKVMIAKALAQQTPLILLDEPFSALDGYLRDHMQVEMMEMLKDYHGQVVMVSHNRDELYRFSEELFVIKDGGVLRHDETRAVFRDPKKVDVARLTGCKNFSDAIVRDPHTIEAVKWGITLHLDQEIPEGIHHIGYRAHYFEPVWGEREENCIKFDLAREDILPFERNYYIYPEKDGHDKAALDSAYDDMLRWFVQGDEQRALEERGMPDYLKLKEEHILLLDG